MKSLWEDISKHIALYLVWNDYLLEIIVTQLLYLLSGVAKGEGSSNLFMMLSFQSSFIFNIAFLEANRAELWPLKTQNEAPWIA
jgi:hypothetical protein